MRKGMRVKLYISVLALAMAVIAIAYSFAYFSMLINDNNIQNISTGVFEVNVGDLILSHGKADVSGNVYFEAPTIINFPSVQQTEKPIDELSDSYPSDYLSYAMYKRRVDDINFDQMLVLTTVEINNSCSVAVIVSLDCTFTIKDTTTEIPYVKYFFMYDEIAETVGTNEITYESLIRGYASTAMTKHSLSYNMPTPESINNAYIMQCLIERRAFNDEVLNYARQESFTTIDIGANSTKTATLIFWIDYASLEEYIKSNIDFGGNIDAQAADFVENNIAISEAMYITTNINIDITQKNNSDFE